MRIEQVLQSFEYREGADQGVGNEARAVASDAVMVADRATERDDLVHRDVPRCAVERVDVVVG